MKRNKILFKIFRYSGIPFLFREIIQKNKVTILLFHDIDKTAAEQTFSYLSKNYNIICLNDFITALKQKTKVPKKALIITFDDGHIGNYDILPIIKKYNIKATIFLCAGIINTNRHFWFKFNNQPESFNFKLKYLSNNKRLNMLEKIGFEQIRQYSKPQALQMGQINEMKSYVNFQSHTMFHPILTQCNHDEAETEIVCSKKTLEEDFNLKINAIAYPNGNYSEREIKLAKKAGYKCGLTVDFGFNNIDTDIFRLKRLSINDTGDINELIVKGSGLWSFIKTLNGHFNEYK